MKHTNQLPKQMKKTGLFIAVIIALFAMQGCETEVAPTSPLEGTEYTALKTAMRKLWGDHMQWTYATVDAFYHNPDGLQAQLDRLLQNQKDIGAAIVPYYGQAAGDALTNLLTIHIQQSVPVLTAARNGDQAALDKALSDWYANAKEIADFLSAANPTHWPQSATEPMLEEHISTTTTYAVDLLQKNYTKAIEDYDHAFAHMMMLADVLADGIAKQFPDKF